MLAPLRRRVAMEHDQAAGSRTYRWQTTQRTLSITVQLAAKDNAGDLVAAFLAGLSARILDAQQNAVLVSPGAARPIDDPSILAEKQALELRIEFEGGTYQDRIVKVVGPDATPELLPIEELARRTSTPNWVLRGAMAAYGWAEGKELTEAEFLGAVLRWMAAPMGRLEVSE